MFEVSTQCPTVRASHELCRGKVPEMKILPTDVIMEMPPDLNKHSRNFLFRRKCALYLVAPYVSSIAEHVICRRIVYLILVREVLMLAFVYRFDLTGLV